MLGILGLFQPMPVKTNYTDTHPLRRLESDGNTKNLKMQISGQELLERLALGSGPPSQMAAAASALKSDSRMNYWASLYDF